MSKRAGEGRRDPSVGNKGIRPIKRGYITQKHSDIGFLSGGAMSPKEQLKRTRTKSKNQNHKDHKKRAKSRKSKTRKEDRKINRSLNSPNFYSQVTQETYPGMLSF